MRVNRRVTPTSRWVLLIVALVLSWIALGWAVTHVGSSTVANCQQIELLKASIRATLIQTQRTIGRPGTAGFAYYRAHPGELRAALAANQAAIQNFAAKSC